MSLEHSPEKKTLMDLFNRCIACASETIENNRCAVCNSGPESINGFAAFAPSLAMAGPGYDASHYATLASYEAGNFWFRIRNLLISDALRKHAPSIESFLEIGCGTGFVLSQIQQTYPRSMIVGSEIFVEGLRFATGRVPNANLIQMDARSMPFTRFFDAIGAFDVIEHIEEDSEVLNECHRALRDDGTLVITVPQHRWLWSAQDEHAHHVRRYTRDELISKLDSAGFTIVSVTSFVTMLLPLMMISRLRQTAKSGAIDPFREFRIPSLLNWLLYAVMKMERTLIKIGISLPFGGSLLLVARKVSK